MKKRLLSAFMALALCLTLLPAPAWAEEADAPEGGAPAADEQPAVQSEPAPQAAEAAVQAAEVAVAEVDGVNYNDIQEAFKKVKQSNGGTLKLLANCETPNQQFDISGNYTLDLNGCTLKGQLELKTKESNLTIQDSKGGGKLQAPGNWDTLSVNAGSATIKSGTLESSSTGSPIAFGGEKDCGTLTIEGGSFAGYVYIGSDGGKTVISGGDFHELRVYKMGDKKSNVSISGGTFDTVTLNNGITREDILASGYTFVYQSDGSTASALTNVKVVSEKTANASASLTVNGTATPYRTFEDALATAQEQGGTLSLLADVNLAKQVNVNSGTFTLDLNGHTLTSGALNTLVVGDGSVTIQDSKGGGVISNTSSENIAVYCYVGNVTILGGSFPSKLYWESGTVSLQGGAFRFLDREGGSWLSAIPEGKALKKNDDDSVADASERTIYTAAGFYVLADHEHDWQAGKCACGREHTDHTWKDGKCTVCHLPCSHGEIGEDGVCKTCGTQFTAKANGTYYKRLADALASENVDDVTLLADDTLSTDVRLERDIMFFPNGHTVSGGGSIVVPSGKRLTFHGNENGETGNAGTIRVEDGGTLRVDEDFTGTVQTLTVSETADIKLSGGTYRTITGSRQKAGTLLKYNEKTNEKYFAFQKQDGTFARYDQKILSETPLENVSVVYCRDKQLTEACGETCEYCDGALRCRIGASGYRDMSDAIRDVPDGGTITLLRDYSAVYNISANVDRAYTIDLNGHSVRKNSGGISLVVFAGTPKLMDSKGGGVIAGLEIDSNLSLTLGDLLPKGWDFQKSDGSWLSTTELKGKTASNVTVAQLPIQSMNYPTEMSMTYGGAGTLLVNVKSTGAVTFQWYKVEGGKETAVGSATTKNQFDLSALKLPAGQHTFRFSATCDGYKKMSQDIAVTVQRASISANLITPPTAQENLTYTGWKQALIIAGSVMDYGTMQYSLTENGTYSQDIPAGTDAGAYTVWYRVIGDANHNDTAPASVAVRIGQKPLTITGVTAASKPYDGTTDAGITSVTFDGVNLNRGTDYTVAASFDDASVGNGKNVTATVTLMGQAAKNYALEQSSFTTTGNITKADGGNLKTVELEQKYTDTSEHTYTPDWAGLPAGQDWTFSSEASIVLPKQDFAADGNLLTYAISGGKVGDKITITLKASCNNYEDFTITLTITLTEKDNQQALRITGGTTVVYGQTLQLGTSGGSGSGAVTYTVTNGTGEATIDATGKLTPVRIGSVTVTATKAGDSEYNAVTSSPVEITITRATPTGEPAYTKITASGKTLADAALGIGTITPAGGTIAWDDPTTTEVVANKSYGWTYTPTDTNYTTLTGTIKLWSKSSGGGSGRTAAVVAPDMPMLYRGCTGDAVKTLQEKLNANGFDSGNVDGIFGAKTYAAVTAFQKANGLGVDGIAGKLTWAKLYDATPVNVTPVTTQPMLRTGSRGDAVRKLQEMLNAKGYTCGSVDGIFGSKTKAAVLAFQKANGLGADGIVGPLTWGKLV